MAFQRTAEDRVCPGCSEAFWPRERRQVYCSGDCYRGRPPTLEKRCEVPGCMRPQRRRRYCGAHYARLQRHGDVGPADVRTVNWGTGKTIDGNGYRRIYAPGAAGTDCNGYILEHRLVVARTIGRPLLPDETVHHKNGDKLDNRPENLELHASHHPKGQRVADLVDHAVEILTRYAPERLR